MQDLNIQEQQPMVTAVVQVGLHSHKAEVLLTLPVKLEYLLQLLDTLNRPSVGQ